MRFQVENEGAEVLASASDDKFVLLRIPTKSELEGLLAEFREKFVGELRRLFRSLPSELEKRKLSSKKGVFYSEKEVVIGLSGTEYQSGGKTAIKFTYFRNTPVAEGLKALGLNKKYPRLESELNLARVFRLSLTDQVSLVDWLTDRPLKDWADQIPKPNAEMQYWLDPHLETALANSDDPCVFLDRIAGDCADLFIHGRRQARLKNRPIGSYWFAKHLHLSGIWLFPLDIWSSLGRQGVPRVLTNLVNSCLLSEQAASFFDGWNEWLGAHSRAMKEFGSYYRTFHFIDHTSTFSQAFPICPDLFYYYRQVAERKTAQEFAFQGSRFLWRYLNHHWGVQIGDDRQSLKLAGKIKALNRDAWAWVDDPSVSLRTGLYEKVVGLEEPTSHSRKIVRWACRMRELLPLLGHKDPSGSIRHLTEWLFYLSKLESMKQPLPGTFQEIRRKAHINSAGDPGYFSFLDYLRTREIPLDSKNSAVTTLRHMWILDATDRDLDLDSVPIVQRVDHIKEKRSSSRHWRTVRNAIEPEVWQIIIQENRRDDFAFSRQRQSKKQKRQLDFRAVADPETGKQKRIWWPGPAVIIDLLLNIPLRKASARFLDSGEGDERVLDIDSLQYKPNHLRTATQGRHQGFFRSSRLGIRRDQVTLGMYVNTNKTGNEYEVPWIDQAVANNVSRVIEWQKTYNPISGPILCTDVHTSKIKYGDLDLHGDTYPIFRDPEDPKGQPLGEMAIYNYFRALLRHCEPVLSEKFGFEVSLFEPDGTPVFDIHSLRVTGVTALLEHGVSVEVVQELVGHASHEMTWYYNAVSNARIHTEIQRGMEQFKLKSEELHGMSANDLERLKANVFNTRNEEDFAAFSMLEQQISGRTTQWEMLPHGICPGGTCSEGGVKSKYKYDALYRERACSLCRFRITGPMFLHGLVQHQNTLMWEIKQSLRKITAMRDEIDKCEDHGEDPAPLNAQLKKEREFCDNLYREWSAEYVYVRSAEDLLDKWMSEREVSGNTGRSVPKLLTSMQPDSIKADLAEVHELRLLHNLIRDSDIITGAQLPRGVVEDRNEMLLKIARENQIDQFFYRVSQDKAKLALDLFSDAVMSAVCDDSSEADLVEDLVEGRVSLRDLPGLEARVEEVLGQLNRQDANLPSRGRNLVPSD